MSTDLIGRSVVGNYRITEPLGEGGMGAVYVARHTMLDEKLAIKVLHPQFAAQPAIVQRFIGEAKAASEIKHPNIIRVIDVGTFPSGEHYIALEFLPGASLDRYPLPMAPDAVLAIMVQVCAGLQAAHDRGIIHRDLKPANLLVSPQPGNPLFTKILDFGIAKLRTQSLAGDVRTGSHVVMGTPAYMSPEQARGSASVTESSDVYALGAILFQLVTGARPYQATTPGALVHEQLASPIPDPGALRPDVPAGWRPIIMACLAIDPAVRPRSARELADLLVAALPGGVDLARAVGFTATGAAVLPQPGGGTLGATAATVQLSTLSSAAAQSSAPRSRTPRRPWLLGLAAASALGVAGAGVGALSVRGGGASASQVETSAPDAGIADAAPSLDARPAPDAAPPADSAVIPADSKKSRKPTQPSKAPRRNSPATTPTDTWTVPKGDDPFRLENR